MVHRAIGHGIIKIRREIRKPLVQTSAPGRVSYEVRPGCSELPPVWSRKSQRMETVQPFWATCFIAVSMVKKVSSYISSEPLLFQLMPSLSSSCNSTLWRAGFHLLHSLLLGIRRLLPGAPKALSPPGWTGPIPLPHLTRLCLSGPSVQGQGIAGERLAQGNKDD